MATNPARPAAEMFEEDFFRVARECTVEAWLAFLGHRWNALILYHLSLVPRRFGEIERCLPTATAKMLSERLASLERFGLVSRPTGARGEPYELSARGKELMPILHQLEVWSRELPKLEPTR